MLYSQIFRRTRSTGNRNNSLIQISNANRQQLTSNNSNSTFGFSSTNSQQITNNDSNSTYNSTQLTGFPPGTEDKLQSPAYFRLPPFTYPCSTGHDVTWNYLVHSAYIFF
ncbi:hypothetical protein AVEN_241313-1 [Araneus ventricosus]|uniref:Uncharacterized protein n=1 Tax=Araneus ventricosus TaxID=182803 RepID=A0A4Y2MBN2_ARAVE|nr:hypothetical protein AVEN_241313-1 [Araneus ventricosus]